MIKVELKGTIYKLPINTNELTLDQGIQLLNSAKLEDKTSLNFKRSIIAVLLNCEVELLIDIPAYQIEILYDKIPYLHETLQFYYVPAFKLKNILYGLINFDDITVEEFSDITNLLEDEAENLDKLLSIIYRKITFKKQNIKNILHNIILRILFKSKIKPIKLKNYKVEEYANQEYSDLFRYNFNYAQGRGALLYLLQWKQDLEKEFWQIFENGKNPDDEEEFDPFEIIEEDNEPKRKELPSLGEMWGLYHLVYEVSNGDKRLIDYWYKKPIKELFVHCTYVKQRNIFLEKTHG